MFKWLFTDEHHEKKRQAKQQRQARANNEPLPKITNRPKPPTSMWNTNKVTQISRGNNSANVNIQTGGHSYQRTVRNGVETIIVDGKVLTGLEAKVAKVNHENWVDDFKDDMADFAEDMRDMAKDMKNMFK